MAALLNQTFVFHAGVAATAYDDVVVDGDVEGLGGADDLVGHVDVGLGWFWIAAGVVVHEDEGGCAELEAAFHDFSGVGGGVVDRAGALDFIADQLVLFVEEEDAEMLARFMRHGGMAIIHEACPVIEDGLAFEVLAEEAGGEGVYPL